MKSPALKSSPLQKGILENISNQSTSSVREVERAKIILAMLLGYSNLRIENEIGYSREKVKRWRFRWLSYEAAFASIESEVSDKRVSHELELKIRECLSDAPRPGGPSKFSAHQYCQILGLALEDPALSGRPVSEWTLSELTHEIQKRAIVDSISRSQVGSFLKRKRSETS